ncbi:response regulator transcription factor [bacterium]|nr:MAG: response regulator transcription factor [bacterium]
MRIRALIIDDEPPARKKIRQLLKNESRLEIIGEASDGLAAVEAIDRLNPDLVFLDIQMPKMNGFEVLQAVERKPQIIFTTAFDRYALKAFDVRALDYLLKPFDETRFQEALNRAMDTRRDQNAVHQKITDLLTEFQSQQKHIHRLLLKSSGKIFFVKTNDIQWIEAEEKYVKLHLSKEWHLHRESMNSLENKLDSKQFIRIHRSHIVNLDYVKELQPWSHGDYVIILKDGAKLNLGRSYRERFMEVFGK